MSAALIALVTFFASEQMAVDAPASWLALMVQAPALGVLIWFMMRAERRMEEQTKAVITLAGATDRNSQAMMIGVIAVRHGDINISELAERLKTKCEVAQKGYENTSS